MKKILFTLILSFLILTKVSAGANDTKIRVENFDNVYGNYLIGDSYYWNLIGIVYANDKLTFCLEPGVWLTESVYDSYTDFSIKNISAAKKREFELYVYYGYGYKGHNTTKYYLATQELIWRGLGIKEMYWSTGPEHTGNKIDVTNEKSEILKLINTHQNKPSFDNKKITVNLGESTTLEDTNKLLNRFTVTNNGNQEVSKNANNLTIKATKVGTSKIELEYNAGNKNISLLYLKGKSQTLATLLLNEKIKSSVDVTVKGYDIKVEKRDNDNKNTTPRGEATLKGAKYSISKGGTVIKTATTDENGQLVFSNLDYGNYEILEVEPSVGYQLDTGRNWVTVKESQNKTISVNLYEKVIENKVEIIKVYASDKTGILIPEKDVEFEVFDQNKLVSKIKTNDEGVAKITLPYGKYRIHQATTTKGYEKVDDFNINVHEVRTDSLKYPISDAKVSARIKVVKKDEYGSVIKKRGISFKIKNTDTGEYVKQLIYTPKEKYVDTFETDENGELITFYPLISGNYQLEEVKSPSGYIPLSEPVKFTLDENTEFEKTETGNIYSIEVVNEVVKGNIKIHKTGISNILKKKQNAYEVVSSKKDLSDVLFDIIADNDVVINDKVIYKKGQVVDSVKTNLGLATSKKLPLATYCVVEKETIENYVLDSTPYCLTLKKDEIKELNLQNKEETTNIEITKNKEEMIGIKNSKGVYQLKPFASVKFSLYNESELEINDEIIKPDTKIMDLKTSKTGHILITGLPYGKYYLKEEEKTGYEKLEKIEIDVNENNKNIKLNLTNKRIKGSLLLLKTDIETGKKLNGAVFKIQNVKTKVWYSKKVMNNGLLKIDDLEYGTYEVSELTAPNGYMKDNNKYKIVVDGSKNIYSLNIKNKTLVLPNTSSIKKSILTFFSFLFTGVIICFSLSFILKKYHV